MQTAGAEKVLERLDFLDALRGIAITAVMFVHSVIDFGIPLSSPLGQIGYAGQRGVQLFYMVSAYTLFYTLDRARPEHHPVRNFYLRRFFRIAPLFYVAILVSVPVFHERNMFVPLTGILFIHGFWIDRINGVAPGSWSIAVETSFYALMPLLFRWLRTLRSTLIALVVASILSIALATVFGSRAPIYFLVLWFPAEFPVFLLGIATYFLAKGLKSAQLTTHDSGPAPGRRSLSALLLLVAASVLFLSINTAATGTNWADRHMLPSAIMFPCLILALVLYPWKLLMNRATRFLGKISYSIYLSHGFIGWWMATGVLDRTNLRQRFAFHHGGVLGSLLFFACLVLLAVPCSMLLWKFVEQPGIRLGRRLIARLEHRTAARKALLPPFGELSIPGNTSDAQF